MKKFILLPAAVLIIVFLAVILIRTFTFSHENKVADTMDRISVPEMAVERFSKAITFPTISYLEREKLDTSAFNGFHRYLQQSYPLVDSLLERMVFNHSLLYKWEGTDPSAKAVVMMGHFDVVPVDESTLDKWDADPFSGDIIDGHIIGRGSMDDKVNVIALMETAEYMLNEGFQPRQTIYFSFGHDEEVGGDQGAKVIAEYLGKQGVTIDFVIDEGGYVAEGIIDGLNQPVAIINTGEKGFVSFKLTINTPGGHSSQPPVDNTLGSLAAAIVKLEENQFEYRLLSVMEEQISIVGPHIDNFMTKLVMANTWLFEKQLAKSFNSHTTTVATMISGGVKDNVIPTEAWVVVNFRILQGESVSDVKQHIIDVVNDERIKVSPLSVENEPSPISDSNSDSFNMIAKTIRQLYSDIIVSPGLVGGGTDSRHFTPYADQVYRFAPAKLRPNSMTMLHGNNEQMSVENYKEFIQFYYQLIKNLQN